MLETTRKRKLVIALTWLPLYTVKASESESKGVASETDLELKVPKNFATAAEFEFTCSARLSSTSNLENEKDRDLPSPAFERSKLPAAAESSDNKDFDLVAANDCADVVGIGTVFERTCSYVTFIITFN